MGLPGLNQYYKQRIKCLAQGQNAVPQVRLEPATPQSRVKHSTYITEPLRSSYNTGRQRVNSNGLIAMG